MWQKYIGLLFDCPFNPELAGCPLLEVRKQNAKNRLKWFLDLPEDEREKLILHHLQCIIKRENAS